MVHGSHQIGFSREAAFVGLCSLAYRRPSPRRIPAWQARQREQSTIGCPIFIQLYGFKVLGFRV